MRGIYMKKITLLLIILIMAIIVFADEYNIPKKPASVDVADIDLDGDLDIVVGHEYNNNWTGISILTNNSGLFTFEDSIYYGGNHTSLYITQIDNNNSYDIITEYYDDVGNLGLGIMFDFYDNLYENHFFLNNGSGNFKIGDINSDNDIDVIFYCNPFFFWGYIINSGLGQYSNPEYYYLDYPPSGLACGDLNGDSRDDIIVCGGAYMDTWINYSTGLQYMNICDSAYVSGVKVADIDQDGDNDLIATRWGMPGVAKRLFIYSNDGMGNFTPIYDKWIDEAMSEIFVSDLNNDNYPDVIYNVSYSYPNSDYELFHTYILFNNQDNTFSDPVNYYTGICSHKSYAADLDGNGWNDIITLNYDFYNPPPDTGSIHILFNDGTGNFVEEPQVDINKEYIIYNNKCKLTNYPNPFNPSTTINFSIQNDSKIELLIFNIKGQKIKTLINNNFSKGNHSLFWYGNDELNQPVSSGIYYYKLNVNGKTESVKKCLLLK